VRIEGKELSPESYLALISVNVDLALNTPGRFRLVFSDPDLVGFDDKTTDFGKVVEIDLGYTDKVDEVIQADITRRTLDTRGSGAPQFIIEGSDRLLRLMRKHNTRSFLDQKSSEVIKKLGGDHGISVSCDDSGAVEPYILQNNLSDFDFLSEMAAEAGMEFHMSDGKLICGKPDYGQSPEYELSWGLDLIAFRPRFSSASAASKIEVCGWDPKTKKPIKATASPPGAKAGGKSTVDASGSLARVVQVTANVTSQEEAERLAKSLVAKGLEQGVTALCESNGIPKLRLGSMVTLTGVGKGLSGDYMVTTVKHRLDARGFLTFFEVRRNEFKGAEPETKEYEAAGEEEETADIEVTVLDALDEPLPDTDYVITLSDGKQRKGKTDSDGKLTETGVPKGNYKIDIVPYTGVSIRGRA